jgi:hypothetical protein
MQLPVQEVIQMIRVWRTEEPLRTTVTIDGQLSAESVAVVEACCNQAESGGKPVRLFLHDVTSVDEAGRMLLSRLSGKGVRLAASGVYTSYLVKTLTVPPGAHSAKPGNVLGLVRRRQ